MGNLLQGKCTIQFASVNGPTADPFSNFVHFSELSDQTAQTVLERKKERKRDNKFK